VADGRHIYRRNSWPNGADNDPVSVWAPARPILATEHGFPWES